jgi:uncharacterized membrane protein
LAENTVNVAEWERWASAVGGFALVAHALRRPSAGNTLLAAGGALLIERALTGHCAVYENLGITSQRVAEEVRELAAPLLDAVETASDDSFPASDPPSWTPHSSLGSPGASR